MVESEETAFELFVAHQQLAKAIEPAVRDLDNPPPCSLARVPSLLVGFLSSSFDMGNVAVRCNDTVRRLAGVAGIGTQVLAASLGWRRTLHHNGIEDSSKLAGVMSVCAGHDDRQRDATTVHQQVTLASIFSPDPSGWARPPAGPTGLSSSPHRYSAIATRYLPHRR